MTRAHRSRGHFHGTHRIANERLRREYNEEVPVTKGCTIVKFAWYKYLTVRAVLEFTGKQSSKQRRSLCMRPATTIHKYNDSRPNSHRSLLMLLYNTTTLSIVSPSTIPIPSTSTRHHQYGESDLHPPQPGTRGTIQHFCQSITVEWPDRGISTPGTWDQRLAT
jgi:hypothetical protein